MANKCTKEEPNKTADRHPMQFKDAEFHWAEGLHTRYECTNGCGLIIASVDHNYMESYGG